MTQTIPLARIILKTFEDRMGINEATSRIFHQGHLVCIYKKSILPNSDGGAGVVLPYVCSRGELMTKGKLATVKEIRPVLTSLRQTEGLALRTKG